jgi:hypothetical protein
VKTTGGVCLNANKCGRNGPKQGKIIKIRLSDVSEEKPIPTAVQN